MRSLEDNIALTVVTIPFVDMEEGIPITRTLIFLCLLEWVGLVYIISSCKGSDHRQ